MVNRLDGVSSGPKSSAAFLAYNWRGAPLSPVAGVWLYFVLIDGEFPRYREADFRLSILLSRSKSRRRGEWKRSRYSHPMPCCEVPFPAIHPLPHSTRPFGSRSLRPQYHSPFPLT